MIYSRRKRQSGIGGRFYRFEAIDTKQTIYGSGDGDFIRLKDENGSIWRGQAERIGGGESVFYRFRNEKGKTISGVSDSLGVMLRDERGNTWRGFVD